MNWKIINILFLIFCIKLQTLSGQIICDGKKVLLTENGTCDPTPYILVFEDNFDGSVLDTSKWTAISGVVRDPEHKIAQQLYTPGNVIVSDGTLKLLTKRELLLNYCYDIYVNNAFERHCEDFNYTAAQVETKQKFKHFKMEMSCRLPKAMGVASSFWTFGGPGKNEIDVFEYENEKNALGKFDADKMAKVHRMNSRTDFEEDGKTEDCPNHYIGEDMSNGFHLFTMVWTPNKMEWYVDGERKRISTLFCSMLGQMIDCNELKKEGQYILNRAFPMVPMTVIMDNIIQVGQNTPDDNVQFPTFYEIDFIRIYKQ